MSAPTPGLYARWVSGLREAQSVAENAPIPERRLQQVWRHQRLVRVGLRTVDGRAVRVLHPGFWNRGSGPDFREAVIVLGDGPAVSGPIEIDLAPAAWKAHGHDRNPAFRDVVLHVVWNGDPLPGTPPVLRLEGLLDAPMEELGPWLDDEAPELFPALAEGKCSAPLRGLSPGTLAGLLGQAAVLRLERKAAEYEVRARAVGWRRALWEGVFAALGYRHNPWPMRRIAESLSLDGVSRGLTAGAWEARLLGVAGFLDTAPAAGGSRGKLSRLWEHWWRERDSFFGEILPPSAWRMTGLRPANHPQRRLALAARWLADGDLVERLEAWFASVPAPEPAVLFRRLAPAPDPYWSRHWTLRSSRPGTVAPLLGMARFTDIAANALLPWLLARADAGGDVAARTRALRCFEAWPSGEDNAVLRLARQRLLGTGARGLPRTVAAQQGLLRIAGDFCARSDAVCSACRFPECVRQLARAAVPGDDPR